MQSINGEIDGDEMSELWRASYEVADTQQVDIDFDVHYLMQELDGKLRIFG